MSNTDAAIDYAHSHREEFLDGLKQLLRIPSISTLPEHHDDMRGAATWLRDRLAAVGMHVELTGDDTYPVVYAEWLNAPGRPTILLYGHYDVQPVDPIELWQSPPFEPEERNGNLYARGAADDKGQTMTMVYAAESWLRATGSLPLNVKFVLEGQEECGGAVVSQFVHEHAGRLAADVVEVADTGMFAPGIPTLETGLRGNVYTEIFAEGASHDLHSGLYGGVAPNPLVALAHIIAGLKDLNGRITIPGFYDGIEMPDDETLAVWRSLPFDETSLVRDEMGADDMAGEQGYTALERMWARPTLDVHGIPGGFTAEGAKTVIPARASAKISMRLVPGQDSDRIFALFKERVQELTPPGIRVAVHLYHGDDAVVVASDSPWIRAAGEALRETFGREAVLARTGGSIPIVGLFKRELGVDSVLMGWGLADDNLHAPNEKISLDNFYQGIDATIRFWSAAANDGV